MGTDTLTPQELADTGSEGVPVGSSPGSVIGALLPDEPEAAGGVAGEEPGVETAAPPWEFPPAVVLPGTTDVAVW